MILLVFHAMVISKHNIFIKLLVRGEGKKLVILWAVWKSDFPTSYPGAQPCTTKQLNFYFCWVISLFGVNQVLLLQMEMGVAVNKVSKSSILVTGSPERVVICLETNDSNTKKSLQ